MLVHRYCGKPWGGEGGGCMLQMLTLAEQRGISESSPRAGQGLGKGSGMSVKEQLDQEHRKGAKTEGQSAALLVYTKQSFAEGGFT